MQGLRHARQAPHHSATLFKPRHNCLIIFSTTVESKGPTQQEKVYRATAERSRVSYGETMENVFSSAPQGARNIWA